MPTKTHQNPVLAIDGGGTRCRFAIADSGSRTVVEGGPANATTDFQGSVRCIEDGLRELAAQANLQVDQLYGYPSFVGLAGVNSDRIIAKLAATLPLQKAHYSEDRLAAVRGALGGEDGFVVHCGTGSFLAAQTNGQHRFVGGWGSLLGDEASAFWVSRQALSLVLHHQDGFLPASTLATALLERFNDAQGIVIFAQRATTAELSELAPLVTTHANQGDSLALTVMRAAADYIVYGLDQLNWSDGQPICLSGGIGPECKAFLPADMQKNVITPVGTPLDGAIQLAQELL